MPRKPIREQQRYQLGERGKNHVISWSRRDCFSVTYRGVRYFVGRIAGIIRTDGMKPIIHNGGKP